MKGKELSYIHRIVNTKIYLRNKCTLHKSKSISHINGTNRLTL